MIELNYNGHDLILIHEISREYYETHKCKICGNFIIYNDDHNEITTYMKPSLTCNELLIKDILE